MPFLLEILALHHLTPSDRRFWSHASVVFAVIYAVFVAANYVVQLATVVPAKLGGTLESVRVLAVLVISSMSYDESDPRDRPNAYYSVESVVVDRPVAEVFRFVQREIPSVYTRMSPMHEKFEILNAEALVEGAEIDCVEGDAKEVVRNRCVVTEVVENRLIAMSSTPTRVYDRASGELAAEVDVWDYFDFEALGPARTRLTQTVVLDMKRPFLKSVVNVAAFLSGTRHDWERQFEEQLRNLASFAGEGEPVR